MKSSGEYPVEISIPQAVSTVATTALRLEEFMNLFLSFNTVNGKCYCFITSVFPSFQSGTRDVRTSSSLCPSAVSHPSAHTVNGKYCCNVAAMLVSMSGIGLFQYRKR